MQVICISRGPFVGGEALAQRLAEKLGYPCVGREELIEEATQQGIQVGKLEMAITRPSAFSERLARERDRYLAFITAAVCDRACDQGLVYHGRTSHLVLSGIAHAFRVRVVSSDERRIQAAKHQLRLERDKARKYLEDVDEDFRKWVHTLYGVAWEDAGHYDVTINLEQLSIENAAAALTVMAQLPDFQSTPASKKAMLDLRLAAHCRLALARDQRTHSARFKVRADGDVVTVNYLPHDGKHAEAVAEVLSAVQGAATVRTTMATTNILWLEETFNPASENFHDVVEIAAKWNAAVELMALESGEESPDQGDAGPPALAPSRPPASGEPEANGGIEDDEEESSEETGLSGTLDELARLGRAGGGRQVGGGAEGLLGAIDRTTPYSLVVVGDLFQSRAGATKTRMRRELQSFLGDHIKAPVVAVEELKLQFLFGKRDVLRALACITVAAVLYIGVFSRQLGVLKFLVDDWWIGVGFDRFVAAAVVFLVVPIIAYTFGTFVKSLLKLIKIE